jgi:hypothetical protein
MNSNEGQQVLGRGGEDAAELPMDVFDLCHLSLKIAILSGTLLAPILGETLQAQVRSQERL